MKVQNMSSHWNLKAARPSYKQKCVFFSGQNGQTVWPKFKNIKGNWTSPEHFTKYWLLQRFHFLREDWAQGNVLPNFEIFLHFLSLKSLSLKSLCNSWSNSCLKFLILDITFRFLTNTVNCQNAMTWVRNC